MHCILLLWAFPADIASSQFFLSLQSSAFTRKGFNVATCSKEQTNCLKIQSLCRHRAPTLKQISFLHLPVKSASVRPQKRNSLWSISVHSSFVHTLLPPWLCYTAGTAEFSSTFQCSGALITHIFDLLLPMDHSSLHMAVSSISCEPCLTYHIAKSERRFSTAVCLCKKWICALCTTKCHKKWTVKWQSLEGIIPLLPMTWAMSSIPISWGECHRKT